ncbi:MAG: hypothetical protein IJA43_03060 [Clostridia bacterium]|nr:hypothetical protein [Clostridia bacterium]
MSKKIIAVSLLMLAVVVLFAACKKDDYEVSFTVPMDDGEVITVYKDEDGEEFVTNVDGDKIPVTTDKDGFYDDITSLVTQTTTTTTKADKDNSTTSTTKADKDNSTTSTTKADKDNTTTTTEPDETTTKKPITIDGTGGKQDSISWQEIKDAANKANKS